VPAKRAALSQRASPAQVLRAGGRAWLPRLSDLSPRACCAGVTSTPRNLADADRLGALTKGRGRAHSADDTGSAWENWARDAEVGAIAGVASAARMSDASRALALALARAGALGAAARLAQHWVAACEEPQREVKALAAASCLQSLLQAVEQHLPEVCAGSAPPRLSAHAGRSRSADAARAAWQGCQLLADGTPPVEPGNNRYQGGLTALAALVARFEAETAQRIPADTPPEASLEDLRLQTPALCPVGCWWSGCAQLAAARATCGCIDAG